MSSAKKRWNEKNYTPIKVSVKKAIAQEFKDKCVERGVSQASILATAMIEFSESEPPPQEEKPKTNEGSKFDTRRKRRKAVNDIIKILEDVLYAEEGYREGIHENFINRIETAESTIEMLQQALESLQDAYT